MKWIEEWKRKKRVEKYLTYGLGEMPRIKCVGWDCNIRPEEFKLSKWERFKNHFSTKWVSFWMFGWNDLCIFFDVCFVLSMFIFYLLEVVGIFSIIPVVIGIILIIISLIISLVHFLMDFLGVFINEKW